MSDSISKYLATKINTKGKQCKPLYDFEIRIGSKRRRDTDMGAMPGCGESQIYIYLSDQKLFVVIDSCSL